MKKKSIDALNGQRELSRTQMKAVAAGLYPECSSCRCSDGRAARWDGVEHCYCVSGSISGC